MTPRAATVRAARRRQMLELVLEREVGLDDLGAGLRRAAAPASRQPVIGLRADHQIDRRRAAEDLLALGLGDAAGDADHHVAAGALPAQP